MRPAVYGEYFGAHCMAALGRIDECWPRLKRALRLARESGSPDDVNFSINMLVQSAFLTGGATGTDLPDLVQVSLECVETADPQNLNTSMAAQLYLAAAQFLAGNFLAADDGFTSGLARIRAVGTAMEWSCIYSATHADVCRASGDFNRAIAIAREGIACADEGGFRFQAAVCRAALADALVFAGAPVTEVQAVIEEARGLVESTGGLSLIPRLREAEIRLAARDHLHQLEPGLREAESMYRQMGALGHADRLLKELSR
jgi:hypothetical protein